MLAPRRPPSLHLRPREATQPVPRASPRRPPEASLGPPRRARRTLWGSSGGTCDGLLASLHYIFKLFRLTVKRKN
jgi:hypothetical protein